MSLHSRDYDEIVGAQEINSCNNVSALRQVNMPSTETIDSNRCRQLKFCEKTASRTRKQP
jgi:hypothetical protein